MKKPKFYISFRLLKSFQFCWFPRKYYIKKLCWKDKYNTPRVEILPQLLISWLWFQIDIIRGTDEDWEWWLWVMKYNDGDIEKAIETWGWGTRVNGKFIKSTPHLNYL